MPVTLDMTKAQPISLDMSKAQPIGAPQLDPTTAGQPNSLAPALHPKVPDISAEMSADAPGLAEQAGAGLARHYGNVAYGMGALGDKIGSGISNTLGLHNAPGSEAAADEGDFRGPKPSLLQADPNSKMEGAVDKGANIADYFLPGARADKALMNAGATLPARALMSGGVNAAVTAAHGDTDPVDLAVSGGLGATAPAVASLASKVPALFLRGLVKSTPADVAAGVDVPLETSKLGVAFSRSGLANKATQGAAQAGNDANAALQNYSGPHFDARPAIKMLEDAKDTAVAQGHPKPYLDAIDELTDQIKTRPTLGPDNTPIPSRTNPANLGLQKFQDTIARVQKKVGGAPEAGNDAIAKLNAPLNAQVPGYAAANKTKAALTSAADQLNAPKPASTGGGFKDLLKKYGLEAAGAALGGTGGGIEGALVGGGLGAATQGLSKLATSTAGRTILGQGIAAGAPTAARGFASTQMSNMEHNNTVRVVSPTGQTGTMSRAEAADAAAHGWRVIPQ